MAAGVYKHESGVIKRLASAAAVNPGDVVVVGSRIGVVLGSQPVAVGDDYTLATAGVFELDALSTDTPADGAILYWDDTNDRLTTTASTHKTAGIAVGAKGSGVTRMLCDINASVASLIIT